MPRPSPRHTRRLTRSKLARRACGNTAATGHYQHRLAADLERAAAPQVPRISTGQVLARGTFQRRRFDDASTESAGGAARHGIGGGGEASGGEQENRRLSLHAEPLDEMEQQASETRVRMLRCTDRRHEGF